MNLHSLQNKNHLEKITLLFKILFHILNGDVLRHQICSKYKLLQFSLLELQLLLDSLTEMRKGERGAPPQPYRLGQLFKTALSHEEA